MRSSSIRSVVLSKPRSPASKIRTIKALLPALEQARAEGATVVFTNGCFDLLHAGHVRYLRAARCMGDMLIVGINRDVSVRALKGPDRPIFSERERAEIVASLESVDYVVLFSGLTPIPIIRRITPDILVKGGDYGKGEVVGADVVERYGGQVRVAPLTPGRSSTDIIKRIVRTYGHGHPNP